MRGGGGRKCTKSLALATCMNHVSHSTLLCAVLDCLIAGGSQGGKYAIYGDEMEKSDLENYLNTGGI